MTAMLLALVAPLAEAHEVAGNEATYELGDGLVLGLDGGRHRIHIGGFVQPSWQVRVTGEELGQVLVPRRTQFQLDGSLENDHVRFELLTDFSEAQPLLNAWVGYRFGSGLQVSVGQRPNPANLREMLFNEGYLSFPERSLASRTLSVTGRELGLFVDAELPVGPMLIRPSASVTSGDGRNSFGADSRDVDLGGLKYGGRLDLLPFGDFSEGNRAMATDVVHEPAPRLAIGGHYSFNDGASGPSGEGHGDFALYDAEGAFQQPGYTKLGGDLLFKWQGVSLLGELAVTSASGLQGAFTDPVGGNPLVSGEISELLALGTAVNAQIGYHLPFGLAVDLRYSLLQDEFADNPDSQIVDTTEMGAVLTGFFIGHDLKVQLAGARVERANEGPALQAELLAHLRF